MNARREHGAATVAALAMTLVLLVGVAVAGQLTRAAVARHRAAAAADLAALSAVTAVLRFEAAPCDAAAATAGSNGAELLACEVVHPVTGAEVEVRVRNRERIWPVGAARAGARAGLREVPGTRPAPAPAWPP